MVLSLCFGPWLEATQYASYPLLCHCYFLGSWCQGKTSMTFNYPHPFALGDANFSIDSGFVPGLLK